MCQLLSDYQSDIRNLSNSLQHPGVKLLVLKVKPRCPKPAFVLLSSSIRLQIEVYEIMTLQLTSFIVIKHCKNDFMVSIDSFKCLQYNMFVFVNYDPIYSRIDNKSGTL